jgi:hypothetical protein
VATFALFGEWVATFPLLGSSVAAFALFGGSVATFALFGGSVATFALFGESVATFPLGGLGGSCRGNKVHRHLFWKKKTPNYEPETGSFMNLKRVHL